MMETDVKQATKINLPQHVVMSSQKQEPPKDFNQERIEFTNYLLLWDQKPPGIDKILDVFRTRFDHDNLWFRIPQAFE